MFDLIKLLNEKVYLILNVFLTVVSWSQELKTNKSFFFLSVSFFMREAAAAEGGLEKSSDL